MKAMSAERVFRAAGTREGEREMCLWGTWGGTRTDCCPPAPPSITSAVRLSQGVAKLQPVVDLEQKRSISLSV